MSEEKKETYYQRNREKCIAQANAYREKHKEKYQQYWKTYYEKKKQQILEQRKEYARKNKDKIYQRNRTVYYPKNYAKRKANRPPKVLKEVKERDKKKNSVDVVVEEVVQEQEIIQDVSELNPTVELPQWTMIISPGSHTITWD